MAKKIIFTIIFVLAALPLRAQNPQLEAVAEKIKSMPSYEVTFVIGEVAGKYLVSGDSYYIEVPEAEVYGDGRTRYEISHTNREVVIDTADLTSRNLLINPTRAFEYIAEDYSDKISVSVDGEGLPRAISYKTEDDVVKISIRSFRPYNGTVPTYKKDQFSTYEVIDFR